MEKNNLLQLIDIDTIMKEGIIPLKYAAIQRYYRDKILFPHAIADKKGAAKLTYRGSAIIRNKTKDAIRLDAIQQGNQIKINEIGTMLEKASGSKDDFIVSRLKENIPLAEIEKQLIEEIRSLGKGIHQQSKILF